MAENTFLGLQPYTEDDAYRFKGRTEESQELFRLIVRNDFTVCYAESGEGKTSLLNAGVFPLLRENMYFPISITFTSDDYQVTPDNFSTIIDRCIKDSITEYNEKNKGVRVEYKLCSTDFQGLDCQAELQQELNKYSWWKLRNYKPQAMGLTFTPVFVFDQFEEVFSMPGSIVWTKKFFDWLEDVSSDSCPDEIAKKIREIIGTNAAFPSIKEEKDFKAVFSLRKEFIGELDYWGMQKCFIPSLKDNRYCLRALTYEGAKKVMTQQERFDEEKVEQILTHFVSQYSREPEKTIKEQLPIIPALLLSVVCDSWEKDISSFAKLSTDEISQSLNKILEKFYDDTIDAVIKELSLQNVSPSDPDSIRKDIDVAMFDLVDVNGKRVRVKAVTTLGTISMEADRRFSEMLPIVKYKEILNRHRIVKVTKIDGEDYVEIVHDSLCPIIAKRREMRLAEEAKEREEQLLREQTRKMRKRLTLFSLLAIVVIGLMALFLWLQRETMTEREAKEAFRNQRDAVQKQKDEVVALNESLNKQMQINQIQKDSLNEQLRINSKQKGELENSLVEQKKLSLSLNEKNRELENGLALIKSQQKQIQKMDSVLYYAELYKKGKKLQELGKIDDALICFKEAANGDDKDALYALSWYYFHNLEDYTLAEKFARRGAALGNMECQWVLGEILYESGKINESFPILVKSAKQGDGRAALKIAEMYENGEGTTVDIDKAIYWYRNAAQKRMYYKAQEDAEKALKRLGVQIYDNFMDMVNQVKISENMSAEELYEEGHLWIYDDRTPEKLAYLIASAENGYPQAQNDLGYIFCSTEAKSLGIYDEGKSIEWYTKAFNGFLGQVAKGEIGAMEDLGDMYRNGNSVVKKDFSLAEKYYRMGAEKGQVGCQLWLGQILREKGEHEESLQWLIKAGQQGQGWAAYLVGQMYENGEGTKKNMAKAIEWYTKSAKTRNAYAENARRALRRLGEPAPSNDD